MTGLDGQRGPQVGPTRQVTQPLHAIQLEREASLRKHTYIPRSSARHLVGPTWAPPIEDEVGVGRSNGTSPYMKSQDNSINLNPWSVALKSNSFKMHFFFFISIQWDSPFISIWNPWDSWHKGGFRLTGLDWSSGLHKMSRTTQTSAPDHLPYWALLSDNCERIFWGPLGAMRIMWGGRWKDLSDT